MITENFRSMVAIPSEWNRMIEYSNLAGFWKTLVKKFAKQPDTTNIQQMEHTLWCLANVINSRAVVLCYVWINEAQSIANQSVILYCCAYSTAWIFFSLFKVDGSLVSSSKKQEKKSSEVFN